MMILALMSVPPVGFVIPTKRSPIQCKSGLSGKLSELIITEPSASSFASSAPAAIV